MFVAEVAEMPGPEKALRKDENRPGYDGKSNGRRSMAQMVTGTEHDYQGYISKPTQRDQ